MKTLKLWAALSVLGLSQGCLGSGSPADTSKVEAQTNDEMAERNQVFAAVGAAVDARDYAALNALADHYRTSRARTPSGSWKSELLYATLAHRLHRNLVVRGSCESHDRGFIDGWKASNPNQPAAIIAEAQMLMAEAWCVRGSGYAQTVPVPAMRMFQLRMKMAHDLLEVHHDMASVDPEYYAAMAGAYRGLNKSYTALIALLDEAAEREPYYLNAYFEASFHFLPQWGGGPEAMTYFARYVARKTEASDKTGFYYRIYWHLDDCNCASRIAGWDREALKQGMRDVYERYPVPFNAQRMIDDNCRAGDVEEAKFYMRALNPIATSDADLGAMIDGCKAQANRPA